MPIRSCSCSRVTGAGSGGSSAAYYLNHYTQSCDRVRITVYERNPYIGGRSTTVNAYEDPDEPVELGGSIFVKVNRNLMHAVKLLGLTTQDGHDGARSDKSEDLPDTIGVYDGKEWRYVSPWDPTNGWWTIVKLLWQYGSAPVQTNRLMKSVVGKFLDMYDALFPFADLTQAVRDAGLADIVAVNGEELLKQNNIGQGFSQDIIQASTRVNYGQNLDAIHGVETMVCMATDGAVSVKGGNWQMFAGMLDHSAALVLLNTTVTGVTYNEKSGLYSVDAKSVDSDEQLSISEEYDDVILASPHQFSELKISPQPTSPIPSIPYVALYVTLFTSPHRLNPHNFNLPSDTEVPKILLTTTASDGSEPPYRSISTLRAITNPHTLEREYLYKVFSPAPLDDDFLLSSLRQPYLDHRDISWKFEKLWHSYPVEHPRTTFENTTYALGGGGKIWYTSAIEGFISTMETSSLMGMNVARLLVDEWLSEKGQAGEHIADGGVGRKSGGSEKKIEEL